MFEEDNTINNNFKEILDLHIRFYTANFNQKTANKSKNFEFNSVQNDDLRKIYINKEQYEYNPCEVFI